MPQSRRKTPFSGKAKKQQIQAKKQHKTLLLSSSPGVSHQDIVYMNFQPSKGGGRGGDKNRYALKFYRETPEQLAKCKEEAFESLNSVPEKYLEISSSKYFPEGLSFPKRPPWNFNMTAAQLDANEQRYFHEYVSNLQKSPLWNEISYFELNLETWRQLWRVLEMCDILLLVIDVRYAPCMLPPSLYQHVKSISKSMIVVLNKVDLVPPAVAAAWKSYFTGEYPDLRVVYFTSCPGYNLRGATSDAQGIQIRRRKGRLRMCTEGASQLLKAVREIVSSHVDLGSWERKIREETGVEYEEGDGPLVGETIVTESDSSYYAHERYKDGILTIGCVGQPNVGKSSVINSLKGRKVVSVSKTPGHTKHFQTIYLTDNVRLCDCPGLVFPSTVPRPIQILMGSYPIAQLREPYTTIRYLAERVDLPKLLRISHPENDVTWSPRDVCDGWAKKRNYYTAKAARLDTYRAANSLLRMALDGRICLWLRPPGFTDEIEKWESCEELKYVKWIQARSSDTQQEEFVDSDIYSDDDTKGGNQHQANSDDDDGNDNDDDESDDEAATAALANKFAALASEDLE